MEPTTKAERDFPKGMRVRLSEAGKEALNVLGNRSGVVVGPLPLPLWLLRARAVGRQQRAEHVAHRLPRAGPPMSAKSHWLAALCMLAGLVMVGALLIVLEREPKRGGVWLSSPWADSEVWRQQP